MKPISFSSFVSNVMRTFKRFPGAIIAVITGSVFCIMLSHLPNDQIEMHHWYWNVVMSCYLGMLLLIALSVFAERKSANTTIKLLLQLAGAAIVLVYYFSLTDHYIAISTIRFTLFALGLHCLIAFIPFTKAGEIHDGFWQYNQFIFTRILTAFLYTGVLYTGLSLALLAMEKLFSLDIDNKLYFDLWIVFTGIFNTWFFLAGFPKDHSSLEQRIDYPIGLKIFTQYVLLPILTVYLLILYAYLFKILFALQWPVGWVTYLVLGFSVAGILSLLLIHPIRYEVNNKWILSFSRFFYFALFPLLILLFFAIIRRISDYGITELRYFVLVLALWLLFIAIYFLVNKQKNIKIIPQTLCLIAFLTSFGPLGAFSVSLNSQKSRFTKILGKNKLLVNGKMIKADGRLSFKDRKEISSLTEYLVENHGYSTLQPYYAQNLDSLFKFYSLNDNMYSHQKANKLLELINITYINKYDQEVIISKSFSYNTAETNSMTNVNGFDYCIAHYNYNSLANQSNTYTFDKDSITICLSPQINALTVAINKTITISFNLEIMLKKIREMDGSMGNNKVKELEMTLSGQNNQYGCRVMISRINGEQKDNRLKIINIQAIILIGKISHESGEVQIANHSVSQKTHLASLALPLKELH